MALTVPMLLSGCRSKKEVASRDSEVTVGSNLEISSGKSLEEQDFVSEKDSEVVREHMEQVVFVFPTDTLGLRMGMVMKTVINRKSDNQKQFLQEINSQSADSLCMSSKMEIRQVDSKKRTNRVTRNGYWYGAVLLFLVGVYGFAN